jgi:hypothetical protein
MHSGQSKRGSVGAAARASSSCNPYLRLSDPDVKDEYDKVMSEITKDRESALKFLQRIGICTPSGRLSKHYR